MRKPADIQEECPEPLAKGQRPLTRHPPSTGAPNPRGMMEPEAMGMRPLAKMCSTPASGRKAPFHAVLVLLMKVHQPADGVDVADLVDEFQVEQGIDFGAAEFPGHFERQQPLPIEGDHRRPGQGFAGVVGFGVGFQRGTDTGDGVQQVAAQRFAFGGQGWDAGVFQGGDVEGRKGDGGGHGEVPEQPSGGGSLPFQFVDFVLIKAESTPQYPQGNSTILVVAFQ